MVRQLTVVAALFVLSVMSSARAADPAAAAGTTVSLFDGKTLQGWTVMNKCKIGVDQENIVLQEGNGWLRSDLTYGDFTLHVEWKAEKTADYDSGIYVRTAATGKEFPKPSYQVNLLQGHEGQLTSVKGLASRSDLVKPGEWNAFDISCIGKTLAVSINGEEAYKVSGLKHDRGYIGIQCEVIKGGAFRFRNIQITELDHQPMFNGKDLAGWTGADKPADLCWLVENGDVVCTGKKGPWLRSDKEYDDFNLRFDYQLTAGGNSGIFVRVPSDGNHHRADEKAPEAGFEVQLLDDAAKQYKDLKDYQFSGSVYDIAGASQHVSHPAGEWNSMEINAKGQHITIIHNGVKVVDAEAAKFPLLNLRKTKGHLGLQNHSSFVRFKNVRIGGAQ
jgi:hypothetical protein